MAKLPVEKQHFFDEMNRSIENEEKWLQDLMDYMGWNIEDIPKIVETNPTKYELCPINNEHRVPEDSMETHVSKCWKKHAKYPDASSDGCSLNDDSASSSKTDLSLLKPSNESSATISLSSTSDRLMELLIAERDAKRRRATYRKKRVHTNKKSYNEVLRELIDNEMKTLEFGMKPDDESNSNLNSENEERVVKNSVYAGIGNWIYHGNPYKRWMKIELEERELLKNLDSAKSNETDFDSKHSTDDRRYFREDRIKECENLNRSSRCHEQFHSDRRSKYNSFDNSSSYERSHLDRHNKRGHSGHSDDRSRRHEQAHFSHSQHRHDEHRKTDISGRHSTVRSRNTPKREKCFQRSPSRDHKRHKYYKDPEKIPNKSCSTKLEAGVSNVSKTSELNENFVPTLKDSNLKSHVNDIILENAAEGLKDTTKYKHEEKSVSDRRSSCSRALKRKHHKKKKKYKKKSKKNMKSRQSSSESSS